jgi:hypothetical protein
LSCIFFFNIREYTNNNNNKNFISFFYIYTHSYIQPFFFQLFYIFSSTKI